MNNGHGASPGHGAHGPDGLPVNRDVTFEARDINVATVVKQLIYLAITIVVALAICVPILKYLTTISAESDPPMAPVRAAMSPEEREMDSLPQEPRLQGVPGHESDGQEDLRRKLKEDNEANETFQWIDKSNGIARIPVKDAMKLIAERAAKAEAPAEKK